MSTGGEWMSLDQVIEGLVEIIVVLAGDED